MKNKTALSITTDSCKNNHNVKTLPSCARLSLASSVSWHTSQTPLQQPGILMDLRPSIFSFSSSVYLTLCCGAASYSRTVFSKLPSPNTAGRFFLPLVTQPLMRQKPWLWHTGSAPVPYRGIRTPLFYMEGKAAAATALPWGGGRWVSRAGSAAQRVAGELWSSSAGAQDDRAAVPSCRPPPPHLSRPRPRPSRVPSAASRPAHPHAVPVISAPRTALLEAAGGGRSPAQAGGQRLRGGPAQGHAGWRRSRTEPARGCAASRGCGAGDSGPASSAAGAGRAAAPPRAPGRRSRPAVPRGQRGGGGERAEPRLQREETALIAQCPALPTPTGPMAKGHSVPTATTDQQTRE